MCSSDLFAPVVSVKNGTATVKRALSVRVNLWFDRSNDHDEGVGTARYAVVR